MKPKQFATYLILLCCWAALFPPSIFSESKRIAIFLDQKPVTGGSDTAESERAYIRQIVDDTLQYLLKISGEYTVINFTAIPDGLNRENLGVTATEFDFDQIILAELPAERASNSEVAIHAYDSLAQSLIFTTTGAADLTKGGHRTAQKLLEPLFNELLEINSTWATVDFEPRGEDGSYKVSVDGVFAGRNIRRRLWVPAGTHVIEAHQERPFGVQILLEKETSVAEGEELSLVFAIPDLTDLEQFAFEEIDKKINDSWESNKDAVEEQFKMVTELFQGIETMGTLSKIKEKYVTWNQDFKAGREATVVAIEPQDEISTEEIAAAIEQEGLSTGVEEALVLDSSVPPPVVGDIVLASTGPLIERIGGLTRTMAHESMFYEDDGSPIAPAYGRLIYNHQNAGTGLFWSALGLWGSAGLAESLLFPYDGYSLAPLGRIFYAGSEMFDVLAGALMLTSQMLRTELAQVSRQYEEAEPHEVDRIAKELDTIEMLYGLTRVSGFGAWTLASSASLAAPFLKGNRTLSVTGPLQKSLHIAGSILTVLGNLSSIVTYNARLSEEQLAAEYRNQMDFEENPDLYESYETIYKVYLVSSITTIGFWSLGAVSSALAVLLPERTSGDSSSVEGADRTAPRPQPLFTVEPRETGLFAGFRVVM